MTVCHPATIITASAHQVKQERVKRARIVDDRRTRMGDDTKELRERVSLLERTVTVKRRKGKNVVR